MTISETFNKFSGTKIQAGQSEEVEDYLAVEAALQNKCEYKEFNLALQRLLDMKCEHEEYKKIGCEIKPYPNSLIS